MSGPDAEDATVSPNRAALLYIVSAPTFGAAGYMLAPAAGPSGRAERALVRRSARYAIAVFVWTMLAVACVIVVFVGVASLAAALDWMWLPIVVMPLASLLPIAVFFGLHILGLSRGLSAIEKTGAWELPAIGFGTKRPGSAPV